MEYKFDEKVQKAIKRLGGEENESLMPEVRKAFARGYQGLAPEKVTGSIERQSLYQKAYENGINNHYLEDIEVLKTNIEKLEKELAEERGRA